jgi:endogenous inhibitor of DNA gyrase (YacG/DUF329 family)
VARTIPCPICRKPALPRTENAAFPFCSARCKLLDLGKWLGEEYRVPGPRPGDGVDEEQGPGESGDPEE